MITLRVADLRVWRRVVVLKDHSLHELHAILQGAMGWYDCHLHRFQIGEKIYESDDEGIDGQALDGRRTRLSDILGTKDSVQYIYDFGDDWRHEITFQKEVDCPLHWPYAVCVDGAGACPPEDCGGAEGFRRLLREVSDPAHPNHREAMNWSNGFQPMVFSKWQANALIAAIATTYLERRLGFSEGVSKFGAIMR